MNVKNPFGLRDGKIIMIGDLSKDEKGLACNCVCPHCKGKFLAKLEGKKRIKHFSHNGDRCNEIIAFLSGMYMLVKEYVEENPVIIPAMNIYWSSYPDPFTEYNFFSRVSFQQKYQNSIMTNVYPEKEIKFNSAEIAFEKNEPKALILMQGENRIALCIRPPSTVCSDYCVVRYDNMSTICLDASDMEFDKLNKNRIVEFLTTSTDKLYWIFAAKALKVLKEINEQNILIYEQIRKAKEVQRKKREEELRKIEERNRAFFEAERNKLIKQKEIKKGTIKQKMIKCEKCGKIDFDIKFSYYQGDTGVCRICGQNE